MLIVREDGNRPHIHCVITEFPKTKSTFCQQLKKRFPVVVGNKSFSCETKDDMEAQLRYLSKGNSLEEQPEVLYNDNIDVESYHSQYWEINNSL